MSPGNAFLLFLLITSLMTMFILLCCVFVSTIINIVLTLGKIESKLNGKKKYKLD